MKCSLFFSLCLLFLFPAILCGQAVSIQNPGLHEVGGGLGFATYHGDLAPAYQLYTKNYSFHAYYRRNISKAVSLRANFSYQNLSADSRRYEPDLYKSTTMPISFSTRLFDFAGLLEYNFFDYRFEKNRRFSPYLIFGFGIFNFNPAPVEPDGNVSSVQPFLPIGLGYKRTLNRDKTWSLLIEFLGRKTFTDYLDNTSDKIGDLELQRGEPGNTDWYASFSLGLSYTFYQVNCATRFVY